MTGIISINQSLSFTCISC